MCTEYLQTHALPLIKAGALTELFGATMVGLAGRCRGVVTRANSLMPQAFSRRNDEVLHSFSHFRHGVDIDDLEVGATLVPLQPPMRVCPRPTAPRPKIAGTSRAHSRSVFAREQKNDSIGRAGLCLFHAVF